MTMICTNCGQENPEPEIVMPDFYETLEAMVREHELKPLMAQDRIEAWMSKNGITERMAEAAAESLYGQWGVKPWRWHDPTKTFYSYCRNEKKWNGGNVPAEPATPPEAPVVALVTGTGQSFDPFQAMLAWDKALNELKEQVTRPAYETWLKDTTGVSADNGVFLVGTPNMQVSKALEQRMYALLSKALEFVTDYTFDIRFQVREQVLATGG